MGKDSNCGQGFKNRAVLGEQSAKEQVRLAILADKNSVKPPYYKALLTSKEVAIAVAEPMLFIFMAGTISLGNGPMRFTL